MKTILIYSGGLDSTVLLYDLIWQGHDVRCLSVDYGQRHKRELQHAEQICREKGILWQRADLSAIRPLLAGSSQTSDEIAVPEGHYAAENMKLTVVPNRNMILLSVAIGWAAGTLSNAVAFAAHAGDHTIYPDCREEFAQAMDAAARLCDWQPIQLLRPYVRLSKADIVVRGQQYAVPFEKTWSCYKDGEFHCGKCGTCVERREAFELADVVDPTEYAN